MVSVIKRFERFYEPGKPGDPILVSESIEESKEIANKKIEEIVEKFLDNGYKLRRGPEGHMSIYKDEARSIHDYHIWFILEDKKEEED